MADSLSLAQTHSLPASYSLATSAAILGISKSRLRRMIDRGQIHSVVLGSWPRITLAELRRVLGED